MRMLVSSLFLKLPPAKNSSSLCWGGVDLYSVCCQKAVVCFRGWRGTLCVECGSLSVCAGVLDTPWQVLSADRCLNEVIKTVSRTRSVDVKYDNTSQWSN